MKKKLNTFALIALFVFVAGGWSLLLAGADRTDGVGESSGPTGGLIRLHILAHSDSPTDQAVKLRVRDAVNAYLAPLLIVADSPAEARAVIVERQAAILAVARQTVAAAGADYPVNLEMGYYDFPLRTYGTLVVPAGRYEAVRLRLGDAAGQNWWCVLFPPLCFVDGSLASPPGDIPVGKPAKLELRWKIGEMVKKALNPSPVSDDNISKGTIVSGESGTDAGGDKTAAGQ